MAITLSRKTESETIFVRRRKFSLFKIMSFTGTSETNVRHLHPLFIVLDADEALFHIFFCLQNETRNSDSYFRCTQKNDQHKIIKSDY